MLNQHMIFVLFWGGGAGGGGDTTFWVCVGGSKCVGMCMWCVLFCFVCVFVLLFFFGGGLYINMSDSSLQRQSLLTYIVVGLFLNLSI